jgi:hypothetical protein
MRGGDIVNCTVHVSESWCCCFFTVCLHVIFFYFLPYMPALIINSLNAYLIFLNFDHKLNYIWNIPVFCEVYKGVSLHTCTWYSFSAFTLMLHVGTCSIIPIVPVARPVLLLPSYPLLFLGHLIGPLSIIMMCLLLFCLFWLHGQLL